MKYAPSCPILSEHIDHYWIVDQVEQVFGDTKPLYAYPGITPELILVLGGHYRCRYQGRWEHVYESRLYSFLENDIVLDLSPLSAFVIVQFKSRALSSLLPFVHYQAQELMSNPICRVDDVWGTPIRTVCDKLRSLPAAAAAAVLDDLFKGLYRRERTGFIAEMASELGDQYTLSQLRSLTGYSASTLERHFKKDTGLTPKRYQSLQRYKAAVQEIYLSRNDDWQHYVHTYGYFDQSHFIKEVKRYTTFTPSQLLQTPGLLSFRPHD